MKRILYVLGSAIAVMLLLVAISVGQRGSDQEISLGVDSKLYKACGLDKLSEEERSNTFHALRCRADRSYVEQTAVRYLEKNRWTEIQIHGTIEIAPDEHSSPTRYLTGYANGRSYFLEPLSMTTEYPMPGMYLGQIEGSRWRIINKNGEIDDFWIRELED